MEQHGDAFVALPGGLGTLEEFFEILVAKSLGLHQKPIVLLDVDDFYAPLLALIDHGVQSHFMKPRMRELFHRSTTACDAIQWLSRSFE